ncbi:2,5-diamino-6-(5-phosphoribosylamino)pyrimidin-4(3H)-one reductase [Haloarcula quadrata]|jgi:2,5-diamino-6-(ribosylamino)-4(3H)-pyrimidinone 5'-phosphate reductase|uniref:2,5-diamino-6-(ribosylamino)-4(3H)-pyrimidinone 5'-phosphate reductase n=3 Tax=Haloarcula TaxID=2237 RepID=M0JYQ6_9EURY|nr:MULTISPECIES: 2,5-diamino-6-(ribosylamino)-4(3H)-pyrimidinone 5'-phosphate reductase [Haloarcula]EMA12441.1 5-amino-6-(5-phosphoribosylamino)uracil reductase [Haloarcula californiae ATCC 33799]EMA14116.1 5-amino-6-(5-phosphoribosylamino)uracil reductase [Haloarcula sinaiiensis ATCC 33800]NHN63042.1 2,5-diamino-6-(ribosylamino)-4(3H)-pyrimidinone 5'-phosphate reductase [Haloarcula sp. JP-Z28]NHX38105.1 2,5-diamino-6-(ribosylamino)-4(3H)-pyrimidinone 5'-phosphate reductase [Haloarcula sp. R1-2
MHVVVNAAMSVDGKLSSRRREQIAISGPDDFDRVDQLRADSDAVMVGVGTILADDPSLTVDDADRRAARAERGDPENPARVIADSRIRTPPDATVLDGRAQTYLLVSEAAPPDFIEEMEDAGAYVIAAGQDRVDLTTTLAKLEGDGIDQLMVEGGGELIFGLLEEALVDELFVYVGPKVIGGRDAPTLADGDGFIEDFPEPELADVERVDDGVVLHWQF